MYKTSLAIPVSLLGVYIVWITGSAGTSLPNLTEECYRCLCHVTTECDLAHGCTGGYCGPFNISKIYWVESGKAGVEEDGPQAWKDCARDYSCSKQIIEAYLAKFVKDCNGDGKIDCFDYMMINGNGGYACSRPLDVSAGGRRWLKRYDECTL